MTAPIQLFIVDDHDVVREGLATILATQPDFAIVGQAGSGEAALRGLPGSGADVVLMDLEMPGMDGVEALQALRAVGVKAPVIVFTVFDTDDRILSAVRAGARGYLLKSAPRAELFAAVRAVHAGGSLLQPVVATRLLDRMSGGGGPQLTERELEVLRVLAKGLLNKEIAQALAISERTVKFHVSGLLRKLGAGNRTEAVAIAVERGILSR